MTVVISLLDRSAIGLSFLCVLHCLAVPLTLILVPSFAALPIADERVHLLLVLLVLPTSTVALTLGCRRHGLKHILAWGLTVVGSVLVAVGHILNFKCCRSASCDH